MLTYASRNCGRSNTSQVQGNHDRRDSASCPVSWWGSASSTELSKKLAPRTEAGREGTRGEREEGELTYRFR